MALAQELDASLPAAPHIANAPAPLPAVTAPAAIAEDMEVTPSPFSPSGFALPPVSDLPRMPLDSDFALAQELEASLPSAPQIANLPASAPVADLPPPPTVDVPSDPPEIEVADDSRKRKAAPDRDTDPTGPPIGSLERPSTREAANAWRQPAQSESVQVVDSTMVEVEHMPAPLVVLAASPAAKVVVDGRAPSRMDPTMRLQAITVRKTGPTTFMIIVGALVVIVAVVVIRAVLIGLDTVSGTVRPVVTANASALRNMPAAPSETAATASASAASSSQGADTAPATASARPVDVTSLPTSSARPIKPENANPDRLPGSEPPAVKPTATAKPTATSPAGTSTGSKLPDFGGRE